MASGRYHVAYFAMQLDPSFAAAQLRREGVVRFIINPLPPREAHWAIKEITKAYGMMTNSEHEALSVDVQCSLSYAAGLRDELLAALNGHLEKAHAVTVPVITAEGMGALTVCAVGGTAAELLQKAKDSLKDAEAVWDGVEVRTFYR